LGEQEKIVEILEEQLARLDSGVKSVQTIREKAAQFRRALFHAAFSGVLTGQKSGGQGDDSIPNNWEIRRLDEVADVRLGRQRSPSNHEGPKMRKYLRAANVTWDGLDLTDIKEMNFSDEEMAVFQLVDGDILVNEASGSASEVGKACLFRGEIESCAFQNTLLRVRTFGIENPFLLSVLKFNALTNAYIKESRGVGIFHIGRAKLASWPVPVPPVEEQQKIVEILEKQLDRIDLLLALTDAVEERIYSFRRSLLHVAFSGELTRSWRESNV
jgi:type I restriction enzyme S subunit